MERNLLLFIVFIKMIPKIEFIFVREKKTNMYIYLYIERERLKWNPLFRFADYYGNKKWED